MDATNPLPPTPPKKYEADYLFDRVFRGFRVSVKRPCPICEKDHKCRVSVEGAVACGRVCDRKSGFKLNDRRQGRGPIGEGRTYVAVRCGKGGRTPRWVPLRPDGTVEPMRCSDPAVRADCERVLAEVAAAKRELARRYWGTLLSPRAADGTRPIAAKNGIDTPGLRGWFAGRGIKPEWMPGGKVWDSLRGRDDAPLYYDFESDQYEQGPDGKWVVVDEAWGHPLTWRDGTPRTMDDVPPPKRSPAMVAAVWSTTRHEVTAEYFRGLHTTYLAKTPEGRYVKRTKGVNATGRRMHAACDGVVVLKGRNATAESPFPGGVLLISEGIENGGTGVCCTGYTAWCALSEGNLHKICPPPLESGVHTVVWLVDLDKVHTKEGKMNRAGQRGCAEAAARWVKLAPWLTHHFAVPRAEDFPALVGEHDLGVELEETIANAEKLRASDEWNTLTAGQRGEIERELDGMRAMLADPRAEYGCAVRRVGDRWVEDYPRNGPDGPRGVDWDDVIVAVPDPVAVGAAMMRGADLDANAGRMLAVGYGVGGEAEPGENPSPAPPQQSESGRAGRPTRPSLSKGAGGGGDSGGGDDRSQSADDGEQDVVPDTDLGRARMFLWQTMANPEGERSGTCYHLKHVDGEFKRWAGNVWKSMRAKGDIVAIRGLVREWLTAKKEWKTDREGKRFKAKINPALKTVEAVCKCVLDEIRVDTEELRFWMPPDFNGIGEPIVGRKPWERWVQKPAVIGLPNPRSLIAFENCVMDSQALEGGKLETRRHEPRLFNEHVLPFDLPLARVREAIAHGISGIDELASELCPTALDFMFEVFGGEDDPQGAAEQMEAFRKLCWYYSTYSTDCKEANIAVFLGPDNAGKGTLMDLMKAMVGEGNFVSSTVDEAADKNHITSWVGKRVAFVSEAESGERADLRRCMNFWKRVSGGDGVSVRELYKLEKPDVVLPTRICVSANEMPDMRDRTGAFLSRMLAFALKQSHTGKSTYDRGRKARVIAEHPGVFVWALGGGLEVGQLKAKGQRVFVQPKPGQDSLASYRQYQSDLPDFITDWLVITPEDAETDAHGRSQDVVLFSRDMWEAYVAYRRLADHPKPESGGPSVLSKAIHTLLWKQGWRGTIDDDRRVLDARTGQKRRMSVYTRLKLSDLARAQMASMEPVGTYGRSDSDGSIPFPRT